MVDSVGGSAGDVVLLHGWPGSSADFRRVVPLLGDAGQLLVPDLLGFGDAFVGEVGLADATADAHAARVLRLIREAGLHRPVVAGYDIGSRIAQALARLAPDEIGGLVITPGYPGIGDRSLAPEIQARYWYQHFHRLDVSGNALDGEPLALQAYLQHFWRTWAIRPGLTSGPAFAALVAAYARPGAFRASTAWYRANPAYVDQGPVVVPTVMLWPDQDPLFPSGWADRLDDWFTDVRLVPVPDCGHFVPLEAAATFADAVLGRFPQDGDQESSTGR